jgi:hypothetical protein
MKGKRENVGMDQTRAKFPTGYLHNLDLAASSRERRDLQSETT